MEKEINDLFDYSGYKIVQNKSNFKFSLDSVLLAEFVDIGTSDKLIVDFCTGNAPVPLILSTKTNISIYGLEIQKSIFDLALESIKLNKKEEQIKVFNMDVNDILQILSFESVDIVTCNPPYFKIDSKSVINDNPEKSIARHEIKININEIIEKASKILKNKGSLYLVHRPERLEEIFNCFSKNNFVAKKIQFIYSNYDKNAIIMLIKATKNGNKGLKVLKPINISERTSYKGLVG